MTFNANYYLQNNPDIAAAARAAGADPNVFAQTHYTNYGQKEGRSFAAPGTPSSVAVPQPAASQPAPVNTYSTPAQTPMAQPTAAAPAAPSITTPAGAPSYFDANYYLQNNPDIMQVAQGLGGDLGTWALNHYLNYGQKEGRLASPTTGGGVQPLTIEPLNEWQRDALTQMSQGTTAGNDLLAAITGQLQTVQDQLSQVSQPRTPEQLNADIQTLINPYQSQVVDSTVQQISDAGEKARARILAATGGRDTSSAGVQLSELDRNIANAIAQATGDLMSSGYTNAGQLATGLYDINANTGVNSARTLASLPAITSGVAQTQRNFALGDIQNLLSAGNTVQSQNQRILDAITGQYQAQDQYDLDMVQALANILGGIPTSGSAGQVIQQPNTADRISSLVGSTAGQSILNSVLGSGSSLPWQSPGNVNPLGGYY